MNNTKIEKRVLPLLRENESIVDIPKKCIWNFLYVYSIAIIIFIVLLNLNIGCEVFNKIFSYNFAGFYIDDIWYLIELSVMLMIFLFSLFMLFFLPYIFCLEKIVVTNERLIIFSVFGVKIIEKTDISPVPKNLMFNFENINSLRDNDILSLIDKFFMNLMARRSVENIIRHSSVTYDSGLDKLWIRSVLIKTVSSGDYTVAFYNYKDIQEKLAYG